MQERRTTIRVPHSGRILYCASEDLLLRDGSLVNVSEQGAGLLVHESHRHGDQVTISFDLPGQVEPVTATGTVRWSSRRIRRQWHPIGLEWLPLEEALRERFHQFSQQSAEAMATVKAAKAPFLRWAVLSTWLVSGTVAALVLFGWVRALRWENRRLTETVHQRTTLAIQLSREGDQLKQELGVAKTSLTETAAEVDRLDEQAQHLGRQVGQLTQDVQHFERSYQKVYEDREQLMQRVLDLEQERMVFAKRFSSVEELQAALREAIHTRRELRTSQRLLFRQTRRATEQQQWMRGNRGYLLRDGRWVGTGATTSPQPTMQIRVRDPEALPTDTATTPQ